MQIVLRICDKFAHHGPRSCFPDFAHDVPLAGCSQRLLRSRAEFRCAKLVEPALYEKRKKKRSAIALRFFFGSPCRARSGDIRFNSRSTRQIGICLCITTLSQADVFDFLSEYREAHRLPHIRAFGKIRALANSLCQDEHDGTLCK